MPSFLVLLLAASLSLVDNGAESLICTPSGYAQVQDGDEYDRVNCVASRQSNPQCSDQTFAMRTLQISSLTYTLGRQLPQQDEYLGRLHLTVDRRTGAYKLVVVATTVEDPAWKNVKTFWGTCANATTESPK